MAPGERCLWPTSFSKFLQREDEYGTAWYSPTYDKSDVLVPGSDDELDEGAIFAKRRKIVHLADSYLAGKPLFIASASLRGPFGKTRAVKNEIMWRVVPERRLASIAQATKEPTSVLEREERPAFVLKRRPLTQPPDSSGHIAPGSPTTFMQESRKQRALEDSRSTRVRESRREIKALGSGTKQAMGTIMSAQKSSKQAGNKSHQTSTVAIDDFATAPQDQTETELRSPTIEILDDSPLEHNLSPAAPLPVDALLESDHLAEQRVGINFAKMLGREAVLRCSTQQIKTTTADSPPAALSLGANDTLLHDSSGVSASVRSGFTSINDRSALEPSEKAVEDTERSGKPEKSTQAASKKQKFADVTAGNRISAIRGVYSEATQVGNSPFLFRKPNHIPTSKRTVQQDDSPERLDQASDSVVSRDSITEQQSGHDVHTERAPSATIPNITSELAPAIDLSFAHNSLGVDFDMIAQYTNSRLPVSPHSGMTQKSLRKRLKRAMRESGASFVRHDHDADTSISDADSPGLTRKEPMNVAVGTQKQTIEPAVSVNTSPPISTQAALRDACLDLCTSATPEPIQSCKESLIEKSPLEAKEQPPLDGITPFAEFNKQFPPERPGTSDVMISTQAMFDAFSPFLMSTVKKSKAKKRANFALPGESVDDADETELATGEILVSQSPSKTNDDEQSQVVLEKANENEGPPSHVEPSSVGIVDGDWSFAALDNSPISPPEEIDAPNVRAVSAAGSAKSDKSAAQSRISSSFRVSKRKSSSSLSGKIKSVGPALQEKSSSHLKSFILPQIVDSINETRYRELDIGAILSQEPKRPSQQSKSSSEKADRGRVVDWDPSSPVTARQQSLKQSTDQSLVPESMPGRLTMLSGLGSGSTVVVSSNEVNTPSGSTEDIAKTTSNTMFPSPALPSTSRSFGLGARPSVHEAQRERSSPDIEATLDELGQSVLSSWDLDKEIRNGVEAH